MDRVKGDRFVLVGGVFGAVVSWLLHGDWMALALFVAAAAAVFLLWRRSGIARLQRWPSAWSSQSWTFLGYDVADEYLESAIAMYELSEAGWEDEVRLNGWSLLGQVQDATRFRDWADSRYIEQRPFCIYGVRKVDE